MPRQAFTWLVTDTHWNHPFMLKVGRPADYEKRLLSHLRHLLTPQDTLIHLGDVILYHHEQLKPMLDSVPGTKILVMGNHDRKSRGWYSRNGFAFVASAITLDGIVLTHEPLERLPSGARLNVHGHWHDDGHHELPSWWSHATHRLLAIEHTGYKPVKLVDFGK